MVATIEKEYQAQPFDGSARLDAFSRGDLINVTETASEVGFNWDTAMNREAWDLVVACKENIHAEDGRLWNVCLAAYYAVANLAHESNRVEFGVFADVKDDDGELAEEMVNLEIIGHENESGMHLTIRLP